MRQSPYLSLGEVARRLSVRTWQVARLFERGILPDPPRVGNLRVVPIADLPLVKRALQQCGYLAAESSVPA